MWGLRQCWLESRVPERAVGAILHPLLFHPDLKAANGDGTANLLEVGLVTRRVSEGSCRVMLCPSLTLRVPLHFDGQVSKQHPITTWRPRILQRPACHHLLDVSTSPRILLAEVVLVKTMHRDVFTGPKVRSDRLRFDLLATDGDHV